MYKNKKICIYSVTTTSVNLKQCFLSNSLYFFKLSTIFKTDYFFLAYFNKLIPFVLSLKNLYSENEKLHRRFTLKVYFLPVAVASTVCLVFKIHHYFAFIAESIA